MKDSLSDTLINPWPIPTGTDTVLFTNANASEKTGSETSLICPRCRGACRPHAKFCPTCGNKLMGVPSRVAGLVRRIVVERLISWKRVVVVQIVSCQSVPSNHGYVHGSMDCASLPHTGRVERCQGIEFCGNTLRVWNV